MRVVLFAPPTFGQEEVAGSLARALRVPQINFGDLMRFHLSRRTELGIRAFEIVNSGKPIPDEIPVAVIGDHLREAAPSSFLMRGHPQNAAQALALDQLLHELDTPIDCALHLHLGAEEMARHVHRQTARRLCRNNSAHRHEPTVDGPAVDGVCNVCGGELYQRRDDGESVVRGRFELHSAMVEPVVQHYARRDLLIRVDGSGTPDEATERTLTALQQHGR